MQETLSIAPRPYAANNLLSSTVFGAGQSSDTAPHEYLLQLIEGAIDHIVEGVVVPGLPLLPYSHPPLPAAPPPPGIVVNATMVNSYPQGDTLTHGNYSSIDYSAFFLGPPNGTTLPAPNTATLEQPSSFRAFTNTDQVDCTFLEATDVHGLLMWLTAECTPALNMLSQSMTLKRQHSDASPEGILAAQFSALCWTAMVYKLQLVLRRHKPPLTSRPL